MIHELKRNRVACMLAACALAAFMALSGCASPANATAPSTQKGTAEVIQSLAAEADGSASSSASAEVADGADVASKTQADERHASAPIASTYSYSDDEVDVDLTQMSSTAVYSAVYQMMVAPDDYRGKVVKMQGTYYSQENDVMDTRYYFVIVQDATACCSQGIEFVWDDGNHVYPDDYPEEGSEAVVTGVFDTYEEGSSTFAHLRDSSFQPQNEPLRQ